MPKRTDLKTILIIGAGPIVIGQACEFDYSGAQACKALREEGFKVVLVNSNPATIMTDPEMADVTYIEPITWQMVEKIIAKERPDAVLPTMGGQTALNCALDLHRHGVLAKYGVEMIGANEHAIEKAEDRLKFKDAMTSIGLDSARSGIAHSMEEALAVQKRITAQIDGTGFPMVIRPSFTLGGTGGGIAYNPEEFEEICKRGLDLSPTKELLIEESLIGWKEFEMEVVRDHVDNCIIVCAIENLDPMGIHTGDSITVAPAQTLTDKEYQLLRNASIAILREIGVDTGGSNVQFAINPDNGRMIVIEMNPRVSRSSALASKATGFPIAKVAAKLAVGYTLDELRNDITGGATPASFEPSIDYVVTKIPRFAFEKFPAADPKLTTQMKSVGEVMAIGRTFQESFQKALRGLETGIDGLSERSSDRDEIVDEIGNAGPERILYVADAFRVGMSLDEIFEETAIDPWFLAQIEQLVAIEQALRGRVLGEVAADELHALKRRGFSDRRLGTLLGTHQHAVRERRHALGIRPVYKRVDTCAAEFATQTAYMYSTYDEECEAEPTARKKIMVLGGGPNRIARTEDQALALAHEIGYPLVVRPSYVLGGRAMEIVHGDKDLERYMREAVRVSEKSPVLLDRFLDDAVEVDVDCISDGHEVMIGGIMEHVEAAGIHSGDSACSLPPYTLSQSLQDEMRRQAIAMARALKVVGLMNVQFAIQGEGDAAVVYVLEVNPRASRTVPFVSKATGQQLAKIAARCMAGQKLKDQKAAKGRAPAEVVPPYFSIKEAVFPFNKFSGVDPILGPEMRSTGEVMGVGRSFGEAMLKSQLGAGSRLPTQGTVVITVKNGDKDSAVAVARDLVALGFNVVATKGTAAAIAAAGIPVRVVNKVKDGRPHIVDMVKAGEIQLVYTTVDETRAAIADSRHIRTAALANRVTYYTTMAGAEAATEALKHRVDLAVVSLQELHAELN